MPFTGRPHLGAFQVEPGDVALHQRLPPGGLGHLGVGHRLFLPLDGDCALVQPV